MWVKICGIQNQKDLSAALAARPDAVGFTRLPPPALLQQSRNRAETVLVLADHSAEKIISSWRAAPTDTVQIYKAEPETLRALRGAPFRIIPAISPEGPLPEDSNTILLDTVQDGRGGTGQTHDWQLSKKVRQHFSGRLLLAGGLDGENVARAIRTVRPDGVDASSGLCDSSGQKDPDLCLRFVCRAREAQP